MVTICHKPGTPAEKTLTVPAPAVQGHLGHGDVLGPCEEITPTPTMTVTATVTPTGKITICHKPGTPAQKTLILPASAIPAHLGHGDVLGPCEEITPTPTMTATATVTPTGMITICHKPGTPAEKTLVLPASAIPAHLGHGDILGPCNEAPGETAAVPWQARVVSAGVTFFFVLREFVLSFLS
jgi:hypothetical protein